MAKDTKLIHGAVRVSGHGVFIPSLEVELEAVLTAEAVKSLTEKGVISGFDKPAKTVKTEKAEKTEK